MTQYLVTEKTRLNDPQYRPLNAATYSYDEFISWFKRTCDPDLDERWFSIEILAAMAAKRGWLVWELKTPEDSL